MLSLAATPALAQVSAEFTTGAIAEYSGPNANQNYNSTSFSDLGISKIVMSQTGSQWGGTQGNDTSVTLTIHFTDNTTYSFAGALNWQLNDGGNAIPVKYFGVTTATVVDDNNDRYFRSSPTVNKTYILVLPSKVVSSNFANLLLADGTDGSANFNEAAIFQALTAEPAFAAQNNSAPAFTNTNATDPANGNAPSYSFDYVENSASGAVLGTVSATDPDGNALTFSIASGNTNGWYAINPSTGAISLTAAGAASQANDFEQLANSQTLTIGVSDGTNTTTVSVKLNETNVNDGSPAFTNTNATDPANGNAPSYSFDYVENSASGAVLGTVSATDPDGNALTFSIASGNTNGWYAINPSTGAISLTAAGAASQANDFEQLANSQTLTIGVSDGTNTTTVSVKLNETNVNDGSPAFTNTNATDPANGNAPSYSFDYVENSASGAVLGTVSATDPDGNALTFSIASGNTNGWYAINPSTGAISLTAAGAASQANDFEQLANSQTLTIGVSDGTNTTMVSVKLNETNVDDSAPVIGGGGVAAGPAASALSVNENQTAVTQLTADEAVSWSITGGNDQGKFQIAADGTITFTAAPDFEIPTDSDTNNTYVLTVTATDATGNVATQTVTVTVLNLDDTAPVITGPNGAAGASAAALSVNENQTGVTSLSAGEPVTWSIVGGQDGAKFAIGAATGVLTFVTAPDFEGPTDGATAGSNTYIVQVQASDAAGNVALQTVTVTVLNLDDSAPLITGPSGGEGASASAITINEGLTNVTTFTANESVAWSIDGGSDAAKFSINASTGAIVFLSAPDYENPTDSDGNNTYVVRIKAVDTAGNISYQTLTVTIANVDEIGRKLTQIGDRLRTGLRSYAVHGLSDMLSFNESLLSGGGQDDVCNDPKARKQLSGSVNANQAGGNVALNYAKRLSECGRRDQVLVNAGLTFSKLGGNWNSRLFASLRYETRIDKDLTLGVGAIASRANDTITGFDSSRISDKSLQLNLYARYRLGEKLRTGAFFGLGRTWYDFGLNEADGFVLNGKMTGDRQVYGWMLSGDYTVGGTTLTTDAIVSRATEKLGSANLSARYLGENRSGIAFAVGSVDVTRISVPVTAPIALSGNASGLGGWSRLLLSPGLLCEDNDVDSSALRCGYQLGAKLAANDNSGRNRVYADYHWESVAGIKRSLIGLGYAYRFGRDTGFELAFEANRGISGSTGQDNRALISLRLAR